MTLRAAVKKSLILALEVAVTAAALVFVFHDPQKRAQMADAFLHADWRWLLAGVAMDGALEMLALIRWKALLRIQRFDIGWGRAAAILFMGEFFLTFTPGLVGGDAVRVYSLMRHRPDKKMDAFAVVATDRVVGMLSLTLMSVVILGTRYQWLSRVPLAAGLVRVVAVFLGVGLAGLAASILVARLGWLTRPAVPRFLRELGSAFGQFSRNPRGMAEAFVATALSHLCYYTSFYCAARALARVSSPTPDFLDVFSIMPIENTLTALPVSFAGVGLRETLFQGLLHDLAGVAPAVGALIASLGFAMKAVWSLPGAAVLIASGWKGRKTRALGATVPAS